MQRKRVTLPHVYDARALRVVVHDQKGAMLQDAVEACYEAVRVVHRLWTPIRGECDDYIANPSPSGYQSLHTAVRGMGISSCCVSVRVRVHVRGRGRMRMRGCVCVRVCARAGARVRVRVYLISFFHLNA